MRTFIVATQSSLGNDVPLTQSTKEGAKTVETALVDDQQVTLSSSQQESQTIAGSIPSQEKRPKATPRAITNTKTPSTLPTARSKTIDLRSSYVSLLSSNPLDTDNHQSNPLSEDMSSHQQSILQVDLQNSASVWKHAMDLAGAGKTVEAAKFFRVHKALSLSKKSVESSGQMKKSVVINEESETEASPVGKEGESFSEGGITFIPGAVTSHMDIGFTPYFNKNLRELKGPIPLTIFNRQWQDLANSYHVEKRVKVENLTKDITTYTGYPYPHEMTQSYATWNTNYRNFVRTLRDVDHFKRFANWAEIHQSNVEFYHTRDNWMTAFRYDIRIRLNAFAFRVSQNGTSAPPDISQRREDIAAICFAETRKLDEGAFEDNPYAKGGPRFGYDWTTGLPRSSSGQSSSHSHSSNYNNPSSSNDQGASNFSNNSSNTGFKRTHKQPGAGGRQRGGYQGNSFDPNHAAKKQAGTKSTPAQGST